MILNNLKYKYNSNYSGNIMIKISKVLNRSLRFIVIIFFLLKYKRDLLKNST